MARRIVEVPLNRVEGDLEIRAEVEDGVVVDAWSVGTLYRGFENLLVGRGALDGLVITPRICGICSTAHLLAAVQALESVTGRRPPPGAVRVRNIALMAEEVQSDVRHALLSFFPDFASPAYAGTPLHQEAVRRYAPLRGAAVAEAVVATRAILEVVAILGGQWPHSSFMVPGGVTSLPSPVSYLQCRRLVQRFRRFYEDRVLGCSLERLAEVRSAAGLQAWLDADPAHRDSHLGFFLRFSRAAGLDRIGRGTGAFLSVGGLEVPEDSAVVAPAGGRVLVPAGFLPPQGPAEHFDQALLTEDVSHSWYRADNGAAHPFEGETQPYATGTEGAAYSWSKAPRYAGAAAETGPLAEALVRGDPLFADLVASQGPSAFVRELARLLRAATLLPAMQAWTDELIANAGELYAPGPAPEEGAGFGLSQVSRGALGHWLRLAGGRITHYQIVTPSAWNASPRDARGQRGPCEQALVGTPLPDPENPAALGHVVRSFDPCLVCTVHAVRQQRVLGSVRLTT